MRIAPDKMVHRVSVLLLLILGLAACTRSHIPKPKGYFRIEFPPHEYRSLADSVDCPYTFSYSEHAVVVQSQRNTAHPCWLNIVYPRFRAQLHLTYKPIDGGALRRYLEESHKLAYEHQLKATNILSRGIHQDSHRVHGTYYLIKGPVASSLQFHVTDSTNHFLRGSLYFNITPNIDSLRPVIDYLKKDVEHLVESVRWREATSH